MHVIRSLSSVALLVCLAAALWAATPQKPKPAPPTGSQAGAKLDALKREAIAEVESVKDFTQQMVDSLFSFGELGFQEFETARYCTDILKKNGFTVQENIAGIPTQWIATWGSGKPVIALGADVDGIPQASQKPGVSYHAPLIEGAPAHGEGHSAGQAVNITAALVAKKLMEREKLPGTLKLWPGVAEELVATKAYLVRDGYFKDVDVLLFTHVGDNLGVSWGSTAANGLASVEYMFQGQSAHAASAPWRGRSALDAVELMDIGWNFRREHLRLQQRSHYVITNGGDQPNVVPPTASNWYYFRETDYPHIKELWDTGTTIAQAAAAMTNTTVTSRILGSAWPQHMNKTVAETMYENIKRVGLPKWSEADQTLAKALQRELNVPPVGLATELDKLEGPVKEEDKRGGGSNDLGDITWNVPTVTLRYPSNIPNLPGHNWANAVAMATPIAHQGATVGANVQVLTLLDLLARPELVQQAWDYFRNVQTRETKYTPFIGAQDRPAVWLNKATMDQFRPQMRKYYFDPSRYKTYLEQLGITYPTVRAVSSAPAAASSR